MDEDINQEIDQELKELAALALRSAFWRDYSALANKYLEAAMGLGIETQEMQMGEMTSIYGRDTEADDTDVTLNIWTQQANGTTGHETMLEALKHAGAQEVHLNGEKVFERRNGEWYFVEKADSETQRMC